MPEWLMDPDVRRKLLASGVVVITTLIVRTLAARFVKRTLADDDSARLAWLGRLRLLTGLAVIVGLVFVWATQIQALALSAVAFAAAIVLATKELILCVTGGIVRNASDAFSVGDRVEIGTVRGDVIGHGLLSTTVLEAGPGHALTGRAVTVPNSVFVNTAVINETFTSEFVLHNVRVPLPEDADVSASERDLLAAAREVCAPFVDEAESRLNAQAAEHGLRAPSVPPRVLVQLLDRKAIDLVLRYPAPSRERARIEQAILRAYLTRRGVMGDPDPASD